MPMAAPRFSAGKASLIRVRVSGSSKAAPPPWTARAAISTPVLGARAAKADPATKTEQAGHVHAAAAEPVAERGAGEHQAAEDQVVGVDGPLQVGQAGAQLGPHGRQRGRDDHDVEGGHERPHPGQRERPARPGPAGRGGREPVAGEPVAGPRLALGAAGAADSSDMVMLLVRSARIGRGRVAALKR